MNSLLLLIIQISIIIVISRIIGYLFRRIHQPQVVGEMVAGIILGPSVLGWLSPDTFSFVFPADSLKYLNILSQIGLLLFMFIVGLELDPKLLKGRGHAAVLISHVSIILPFMLGAIASLYLYPNLSNDSVSFTSFALFIGASMSITAFPVLARILTEKNLLKTKLGAVTTACAAVDDVTAWSILAIVVAVARSGSKIHPFWFTISGAVIFIGVMIFIVRPSLKKLDTYFRIRGNILSNDMLGFVILLMLASAWTTEWLGIHALFGAFLMGAMMPRNKYFLNALYEKLNDITIILLLPIFFALTGIHTKLGLISGAEMWLIFGLILTIAVSGKLGGAAAAAKISSLSWRESIGVGLLMNTRGLMELIILSIGLELGIISPALFTMMVMMALVTTFMATPLFEWIYPNSLIQQELREADKEKYKILIPVSYPSSGPGLMRIASAISPQKEDLKVYALHLARAKNRAHTDITEDTRVPDALEIFQPMFDAAGTNSIEIRPVSFTSRNVASDIKHISDLKDVDMILMGWHKPILGESILSGTVQDVIRSSKKDVCVYLERKFGPYTNILVPFRKGIHDNGAIILAHRISLNLDASMTALNIVRPGEQNGETSPQTYLQNLLGEDFTDGKVKLEVIESDSPLDNLIKIANQNFDLVVVGLSVTWGLEPSLFSKRHERLARECPASLLIFKKYNLSGSVDTR